MADEFFDDEEALMAQEAAGTGAAGTEGTAPRRSRKGRAGKKASGPSAQVPPAAEEAPRRDAPPFWMVLAIAVIALVLGIVIGYLIGTSATLAELNSQQSAATQNTSMSATDALPEGHPNLTINEDGTATVAGSGAEGGANGASTSSAR